jgi:hypothetical protein
VGIDRLFLCGFGQSGGEDDESVCLNTYGPHTNVNLKISDLSQRLVSNIPDLFIDLLEVAAYIYTADQAVPRGGGHSADLGRRWRRKLRFDIAVREPATWNSQGVKTSLEEALRFLTEDEFEFTFSKLEAPPPREPYFDFGPDWSVAPGVEEVVLFSGGLDSLGGAIQETVIENRKVALVSHRSAPTIAPRQRELVQFLTGHCEEKNQPLHIPVWVHKHRRLTADTTQRTRSFLYASLATTVSRIFGLRRIRFYENGIISLNLPISAQLLGTRATRGTHPQTLHGFSKFFSALTGKKFDVENPFLWKTKADVVRLIHEAGCGGLIRRTLSCSHVFGRTKLHTHCGRCSQCIDRRFATLGTGLAEEDPEEMYEVDLLTGSREIGENRTMIESYVRTAREVREMSDMEFFGRFGEISRVLNFVEGAPDEAASRILELYRRHADYVQGVIVEGTETHAQALQEGRLPDSCLLVLALPEKYKGTGEHPENGCIFRREGDMWTLAYEGTMVPLRHQKGFEYLVHLLRKPGELFSATELRALVAEVAEMPQPGSAGELLDEAAQSQYKDRLGELESEIQTANKNNDLGEKQRLIEEREFLLHELSSSKGIGGRRRRASDDFEKHRKAVSMAIGRALDKIQYAHPKLHSHLSNSLRLGHSMSYSPSESPDWIT